MVNKRGELTSQQLITIIILIVSFVIILAFLAMLNLRGTIDEEGCKSSLAFSQIPFGGHIINLRCKTQNVCLSMGGNCLTPSKNTVKTTVRNEGEIDKEISRLIARCWGMMGEGQINYGSNGYCAICYKIYFDDKIKSDPEIIKNGGIPYFDIYSYMNTKMPDKEFSYLYYLYSLYIKSDFDSVMGYIKTNHNLDVGPSGEKIDVNGEYVVMTGFKKGVGQFPPILVKYTAADLKDKTACSSYLTEI